MYDITFYRKSQWQTINYVPEKAPSQISGRVLSTSLTETPE